jgi:hypothetical protein
MCALKDALFLQTVRFKRFFLHEILHFFKKKHCIDGVSCLNMEQTTIGGLGCQPQTPVNYAMCVMKKCSFCLNMALFGCFRLFLVGSSHDQSVFTN